MMNSLAYNADASDAVDPDRPAHASKGPPFELTVNTVNPTANPNASEHDIPSMNFTFAPGTRVLDRFTIRRGIGTGGFGEVYFAVSDAGKEVALKRIQRNLDIELRGVSHCLNLKHPNLVSLHDICRDRNQQSWVVMEYVAGPNLRQALDQSPELFSDEQVHRWFGAIASGVGHLHDAGLVHRDIKPGNVFDDAGIVKIGDYGLSKFVTLSHRSGHTQSVGTVHYMAPEIGRGQYGREVDLYAAGVLLHELVTGRVPFDGESPQEIIVKHLTDVPDLSCVRAPYRDVIAKALAKDPAARYSSINEMADALGDFHARATAAVTRAVSPTPERLSRSRENPVRVDRSGASHDVPNVDDDASIPTASFSEDAISAGFPHPGRETPALGRVDRSDAGEPLAGALRRTLGDVSSFLHAPERSGLTKFLLVALGIVIVLFNTYWLLPLLSMLLVVYVPYYVIRQMVLGGNPQPSYAQANRLALAREQGPRALPQMSEREAIRLQLGAKRPLDRMTEILISWIATTFVVTAFTLLIGLLYFRNTSVDAVMIAPLVAASIPVVIASWALTAVGKLWEDSEGHGISRRVCLAGIGAGVGAIAFGVSRFLFQTPGLGVDAAPTGLPSFLYADGVPGVAAWMAHFCVLFAGLRWWRLIDPLRRKRFTLWAVAVSLVGEWFIQQFLPIPQPNGYFVAGGIAVVAQLSATWIHPQMTAGQLARSFNNANFHPGGRG